MGRVYNFRGRASTERRIIRESSGNALESYAESIAEENDDWLHHFFRFFERNIFFSLPFFKYFRHHSSRLCPLVAIEKIGRKTVETVLASGVRPTPHEPTNSHTFQSVLHTLFAASGARARVTSVGREEGDINFCRKPAFLRVPLRAPPTGFDGCSFVVRSLNAGAGKERSIFNLRLHAKREERKSTNDALCDTRASARLHVHRRHHHVYTLYTAMPRPR